MKEKFLVFILLILVVQLNGQIIADHTVVDKFENIPQQYIDSIKKMWVQVLVTLSCLPVITPAGEVDGILSWKDILGGGIVPGTNPP